MWSGERLCLNAKCYSLFLEALASEGEKEAEFIAKNMSRRSGRTIRLLDIPCGTGRVSVPLAKRGFNVTGVDASKYYVSIAKNKIKNGTARGRAHFIAGNMRDVESLLVSGEKFDAVANVFTSIGYGTKKEDLKFFRSLRKITKPGGLFFVVHLANKNSRDAKPFRGLNKAGNVVVIDEGRFNKRTGHSVSKWRFYRDNGKTLKPIYSQVLDIYLYTAPELKKMLERTGWKVTGIFNSEKKRRPPTRLDRNFSMIAKAV